MNVWELSPGHIESLQGGDGGAFRDFVNRVIRAHMAVCGIPSSRIATDSRNMKDGGVDTQVDQHIRSYSGDIAGQRLREAAVAAQFLQHPIAAIREWARVEKTSSEHEAARWRQQDEETFI
ncbi:MAG: hypothetical protein ACLPYZ_05740 [Limisphaerales bacterium]